MQFTFAVVAAATLSFANAAVQLTNGPSTFSSGVAAGTPLEITWSGAEGPVTLTLKSGESTNLKTVETIVSGQSGTSYTWTPSTSLPEGTYALQIDDSTGVPNYSVQFAITGGAASSSPSSVSSTASSSHASSGYPVSKTDSSSSSTSSSYSTTSSTGPYTTAAPTYSGNSTSTSSHTGTHTNGQSHPAPTVRVPLTPSQQPPQRPAHPAGLPAYPPPQSPQGPPTATRPRALPPLWPLLAWFSPLSSPSTRGHLSFQLVPNVSVRGRSMCFPARSIIQLQASNNRSLFSALGWFSRCLPQDWFLLSCG
ncbi:unnamed protein product [Diplocarpon coronariae]